MQVDALTPSSSFALRREDGIDLAKQPFGGARGGHDHVLSASPVVAVLGEPAPVPRIEQFHQKLHIFFWKRGRVEFQLKTTRGPFFHLLMKGAVIRHPNGHGERGECQGARHSSLATSVPSLEVRHEVRMTTRAEGDALVGFSVARVVVRRVSEALFRRVRLEHVGDPASVRLVSSCSVDAQPRVLGFASDGKVPVAQKESGEYLLL